MILRVSNGYEHGNDVEVRLSLDDANDLQPMSEIGQTDGSDDPMIATLDTESARAIARWLLRAADGKVGR